MISQITLDNVRLPQIADSPLRQSDVWGESFEFVKGNRYLIRAESGSGKSSLCDFLFGNRIDYQGSILIDGSDTRRFSPERWCELRRCSLAYMSQDARLFDDLTVAENIDIKNRLTRHRTTDWIIDALRSLDIEDKMMWPARKLSVGQRQRVAAVRALCQPFDFLLLDEPVSHLDMERAMALAALIDRTADGEGGAVIITSVGNDLPLKAKTVTL